MIEENEDQREYLPNEATDWILDVQWPGQVPIDALQLAELFDTPFRKRHGRSHFLWLRFSFRSLDVSRFSGRPQNGQGTQDCLGLLRSLGKQSHHCISQAI